MLLKRNFCVSSRNPIASTSSSIVEILQARAARAPEREAYRFLSHASSTEEVLTYAELDQAARRIAAHLQSFTMPGDRALLLYRPGLDFIQGFLGCLYAGVIAVPAYPPHPTRPARDLPKLRGIIGDARPAAILTSVAALESCERLFVEAPELHAIRWIATDALPSGEAWSDPRVGVDHLAFLQYTSGSTGLPKGVMVSHANLMHNERAIATIFGADEESTIVGWLPMYHDMGLIGTMLHGLYTGARCVLMSPMEFLEQPIRWLEAIAKFRAHTSGGPNFAYDLCVRRVTEEQKAALDLSSWRIAFNGAEPVRAATLARFAETFAASGFRSTAFYPCYGLAEGTLVVSGGAKASEPDVRRFDGAALESGRAVAGDGGVPLVGCGVSAMDDQRIVIVDPETRELRADGQTGEIWVAGPSVARGYWEKSEQSEATFGAHVAGTGEGPFLRTGDLGFLDRGELFVNGRRKDLIIIRGRNHYPHDLEHTVEQSDPVLRAGCGAAFSVDVDGAERLVVVQEVDRHYRAGGSDGVAESIRRRVAEEHEIPLHALVLIKTGFIPKTTSGKIQRSLTKKRYLERDLPVVGEWTWPSTEVLDASGAASVAEIAARLLGCDAAALDLHAPFFALGFDSLQLFEFKNAIERELGVELQLAHFMNDAGLASLAARVDEARGSAPSLPIARTEGDQPLSNGQQRLWFLEQLAPGSSYNETLAMRLDGPLDADALESAVNAIVERHETLRTVFVVVDGQPVQRRAASLGIEMKRIASSDPERCVAEAAAKPFDLARGPLLRTTLVTVAPERHVFAVTIHHIAADGWSAGIFLRELAAAYGGETLAPLPIQYADYAAWMRSRLASGLLDEQLAYWRETLAGAPTTLSLPLDRPRPPVRTTRGATRRFALPAELAARLKDIARGENATLFMTLLAAFNVLLHRYTGQEDLLVGSPVAGRNRAEAEGLIGFFVNTLVLRGDLSGDPSFRDVIARVKAAATGAYAHQELPFEVLVDELKPERTLTQAPLVQVLFALRQANGAAVRLGPLRGELFHVDNGTAKADLALSMDESAGGLSGALEYNADLFDDATIAHMLAHFEQLLVSVSAVPDQPLSAIELLTEQERRRMLVEWNDTARPVPERTVVELFREQVRVRPHAEALSCHGEVLTYAELAVRVDALAAELRAKGAGPEELIAIRMTSGIDAIVAMLAVLASGAAYLPIDPAYPEERTRFILDDAKPLMIIRDGLSVEHSGRAAAPKTAAASPQSTLAYVIYTSGSTGRPKGVLIEHRGLTNFITAFADVMKVTPESRVLQFASLSFDASVEETFTALTTGACLVLAKREDLMPVQPLVATINRERVTTALLPPSVLALLEPNDVPTMRVVASGGEACSAAIAARWGAQTRFINAYGPTEITVAATVDPYTDGLSIGRPIANATAYILDRNDRPALPGVPGELCIGGAGVARGYLGRPELTAERFFANPFGEGRLYRTGDRARFRADGRIEFLGRLDHQVKLRGFRIELGEIEATLERHDAVDHALVLVRDSAAGEKRLVAYVVAPSDVAPADLRAFARQSLPEYMVPPAIVILERFPLTAHGKVDVKALPLPEAQRRERAIAPRTPLEQQVAAIWRDVLGLEEISVDDDFFAMGGHSLMATQVVSRINADFAIDLPLMRFLEAPTIADLALAVDAQRSQEIKKRTEEQPMKPVQQRIAQLSPEKRELLLRTLRTRGEAAPDAPPPIAARKRNPNQAVASYAQQRLWFLWQLEPESAAYNMPGALRCRGKLDYDALKRCLDEIVRRHETLRTTFRENEEQQPIQVVGPPDIGMPLKRLSLVHLPEEEREAEAARLASIEGHTPFDLSKGPLFRATVIELGPDDHAFLLTMHHVISDGWSVGVLIREIVTLYETERQGLPSPLPELEVQYADFSEWQRENLSGDRLERYARYWLDHVGAQVPELELPTDFPRPPHFTDRGAMKMVIIDRDLTAKLKNYCQRERLTLFPLLLAGIQTVLHCHTGAEKVVIGTDVANRNRAETEAIIGFFVNQLVLLTDFSGNPTLHQTVRRAWETSLGAYAHQDYPFDFLVNRLNPKRDLSRTPLFSIKFVLQNTPTQLLELGELTIGPLLYENTTAKFDILFNIQEEEGQLVTVVTYKTDLFKPTTIATLMRHLEFTLGMFVDEPELALGAFRARLDAHEREYQKARQNEFKEASKRKLKRNPQPKDKAMTA